MKALGLEEEVEPMESEIYKCRQQMDDLERVLSPMQESYRQTLIQLKRGRNFLKQVKGTLTDVEKLEEEEEESVDSGSDEERLEMEVVEEAPLPFQAASPNECQVTLSELRHKVNTLLQDVIRTTEPFYAERGECGQEKKF